MPMPSSKALFGYDIVDSSKVDDDQLDDLRREAKEFVEAALTESGADLTARANYSYTGDGSLSAFPEQDLPALVDAAYLLQPKLYQHNRRHRPAIRLRLAVHTAPVVVTEGERYQRPTINLSRLLAAKAFDELVEDLETRREVPVALVVSDQAYRAAVKGRHTERLRPDQFAPLRLGHKEFGEQGWVWAPGLDPDALPDPAKSSRPSTPSTARNPGGNGPAPQFHTENVYGVSLQGSNYGPIESTIHVPGGPR